MRAAFCCNKHQIILHRPRFVCKGAVFTTKVLRKAETERKGSVFGFGPLVNGAVCGSSGRGDNIDPTRCCLLVLLSAQAQL